MRACVMERRGGAYNALCERPAGDYICPIVPDGGVGVLQAQVLVERQAGERVLDCGAARSGREEEAGVRSCFARGETEKKESNTAMTLAMW